MDKKTQLLEAADPNKMGLKEVVECMKMGMSDSDRQRFDLMVDQAEADPRLFIEYILIRMNQNHGHLNMIADALVAEGIISITPVTGRN